MGFQEADNFCLGRKQSGEHYLPKKQLTVGAEELQIRHELTCMIVCSPIVIAWRGTFSSPKKSEAASILVTLSSVTSRVFESEEDLSKPRIY